MATLADCICGTTINPGQTMRNGDYIEPLNTSEDQAAGYRPIPAFWHDKPLSSDKDSSFYLKSKVGNRVLRPRVP